MIINHTDELYDSETSICNCFFEFYLFLGIKMSQNVIETTNIQYKIALNTDTFKELVETAENELFKNSKGETKLRSRKLRGTWVKPFQKLVNEYEKQEFKMLGMCLVFIIVSKSLFNFIYLIEFLGKAARINDEKKREDASYFRASAQCNEKKCESEYTFSMLNKPNIEGVGFVEILVNRVNDHKHAESSNFLHKLFNF